MNYSLLFSSLLVAHYVEASLIWLNGSNIREYEFPYALLSVKCRLRQRRVGSQIKQEMEFVTVRLGTTIVLQCNFCSEEGTSSSKLWYYIPRSQDPRKSNPVEVKLGLLNVHEKNHFSTVTDHSLVIRGVVKSDAGYYFCSGSDIEQAGYKFNYMVDVIKDKFEAVSGSLIDWKQYSLSSYPSLNERIAEASLHGSIRLHATPEWSPWSRCDGCASAKVRVAECKLFPWTPSKSMETCQIIGSESDKQCRELPFPVVFPFNDSNLPSLRHLAKEHEISCQSLDLAEAMPEMYKWTSEVRPFIQTEHCFAPCINPNSKSTHQPKFRNSITLQEGDHITLVCPESALDSVVVWKKDGIPIDKRTDSHLEEHILVDTFSNLYITYASVKETGNYTCFVNGAEIQEVVVLVHAEAALKQAAFLRHMRYLGFVLMFGIIFYVAGIIVAWTQRQTFKKIDFDKMERRERESENKFGPGCQRKLGIRGDIRHHL